MNNPIFPPPFGQSSSSSSPKLKNKSVKGDALSFTSGGHGVGGQFAASSSTRDHDQFDSRSLWRDNVSSSSSNVQDRGAGKSLGKFVK